MTAHVHTGIHENAIDTLHIKRNWNHFQFLLIVHWINKIWYIHKVQQYTVEKTKYSYTHQVCVHTQPLSHVQLVSTPLTCGPPGSSVRETFQAKILEWIAISSSRGFSWPRDLTCISCIDRWILYNWARCSLKLQHKKKKKPKISHRRTHMNPFKNIQKQKNETKTFFWYMHGRKLLKS